MANLAIINGYARGPHDEMKILKELLLKGTTHPQTKKPITYSNGWFLPMEITPISNTNHSYMTFKGDTKWSLEASLTTHAQGDDIRIGDLEKLLPNSEVILITHEVGAMFTEFYKIFNGQQIAYLCQDMESYYDEKLEGYRIITDAPWMSIDDQLPETFTPNFDHIVS